LGKGKQPGHGQGWVQEKKKRGEKKSGRFCQKNGWKFRPSSQKRTSPGRKDAGDNWKKKQRGGKVAEEKTCV